VVPQQYAPDAVTGRRYYEPSGHGEERQLAERLKRIRDVLAGETQQGGDDHLG
jgi:putative ATPase